MPGVSKVLVNAKEINEKKCQFLHQSVYFLGHRVENGKKFPSEHKIKAVINFPEPKSIKRVQSSLDPTGYFGKCNSKD